MEPLLLHDIIRVAAARHPNRVAVSHNERSLTFAEAEAQAAHLARVFAGRGVSRGDRVAWWSDTSIEACGVYYGLAQLGAVFVPLNPRFSATEARGVLDLADPRFVVTDDHHDGDVTIGELLAEQPRSVLDDPEVHETDADVIFYTSGTTGAPKGAVLSHRSNRLRTTAMGAAPTGPSMSIFPQFHWGGWSFVHSAWYSGDEIVFVDGGDTEALLAAVERRRVAKFYAIPAIWKRIFASDPFRYDLSSLRQVNTGTSATPIELRTSLRETFPGTTTSIGYGATEAGGLCTLDSDDLLRKPGSVGLPAPGLMPRIEDGEFWVRTPQMFLGYFRNPEATAAAVVDRWYRTGDLVERDDEGYLWVVGRVKDMIRTGGETVAPPEIDVVLQRHPAVADGAVAGIPDDDWGEIVAAFIVLRPGHSLDLAEVRRHCGATLAGYKHPRRLYLLDAIPRTGPTGQVQRRRLTEMALAAPQATGAGDRLEFA